MSKRIKYILILVLMLMVASGKIEAEELAPGSYKMGDIITYNGMNFYVIENSDEASDSVTMLKAEPLTVEEVNKYGGVGTDNNHVNRYTGRSVGTAYNSNGYGSMAYYSSETCKYGTYTGCMIDYEKSDVKYVVDAWAADKFEASDLKKDNLGYKTRLITFDELTFNLGYGQSKDEYIRPSVNDTTPSWVYNHHYWTMSTYGDSTSSVWFVDNNQLWFSVITSLDYSNKVRPVVTLKKRVDPVVDSDNKEITSTEKVEPIVDSDNKEITSTEKVNVPNTLLNKTTLWLTIGIIAIIISVIVIYIVIKGRRQRK